MRTRTIVGGLLLALADLQYLIVQPVVAAAWPRPYDWNRNFISDLGNTVCDPTMSVYVCSPQHAVMNVSFVLLGLLGVAGVALLRPALPPGGLVTATCGLWVVAGLGKAVVGLAPENVHPDLHVLGAASIPLVSVTVLLVGLALRRTWPALTVVAVGVAVVQLVALALLFQVPDGGTLAGLGAGAWERLASHPGNVCAIAFGLTTAARAVSRAAPTPRGSAAVAPR